MDKLKIAIVVHGRFGAFALAQELIKQKHHVTLFTNYPKYAVKRFGIPPKNTRSFLMHGVMSKIFWLLYGKLNIPYPEAYLNKMFGRWAARMVTTEKWDVLHLWSGVAEEILKATNKKDTIRMLMRGSSHIRTQEKILREESERTKRRLDLPSRWLISREEREYAMADYIRVMSSFTYSSFINEGIDRRKLLLIPSGVSVKEFRPLSEIAEARSKRILNKKKLRILYVGKLSFQKGMWDMERIINKLGHKFEFKLVGPLTKEIKNFKKKLLTKAEFIPKRPQHDLPKWYSWADLFLFPSIQDGYAVVLAQAQASGLPIFATTNCAGPDIIKEGKTGHILPIRNPEAFMKKLLWYDTNRESLKKISENVYREFKPLDWSSIAQKFSEDCIDIIKKKENVHKG